MPTCPAATLVGMANFTMSTATTDDTAAIAPGWHRFLPGWALFTAMAYLGLITLVVTLVLHIRRLGLAATILRPAGFMEDFVSPTRFFQNGSLNVPWHDDLLMQLIAIDDIGAFAAVAFADPERYVGRAMEITGDRLTAPQIAAALSAAAGRPIPHSRVPLDVLWQHAPEAAKVFTWADERYFDTDPASLRAAHPNLMDFTTWLNRSGTTRLLAQLQTAPA
jgi:uncharacterized protein YbjT (DUF2867 family)